MGLSTKFVRFVKEVYTVATWILKGRDPAVVIPEIVGLKQRYPLSPILFNLYTTAILNAVDSARNGYPASASVTVSCLAFANDLARFADSPQNFKPLLISCALLPKLTAYLQNAKF